AMPSSISAPSSAPALANCAKARRWISSSSPIARAASRRPRISKSLADTLRPAALLPAFSFAVATDCTGDPCPGGFDGQGTEAQHARTQEAEKEQRRRWCSRAVAVQRLNHPAIEEEVTRPSI